MLWQAACERERCQTVAREHQDTLSAHPKSIKALIQRLARRVTYGRHWVRYVVGRVERPLLAHRARTALAVAGPASEQHAGA